MALSRLQFLHAAGALALAPFTLNPVSAFAQTRETGSLAPVVVTATRVESKIDETIAEVSVISRQDLQASAGLTLSQILSQQPGIQFSASGGLGQPSSLFIRGMESRHTLLLVDGVRLGFVDSGQPTLNNLPISSLDRIEVVRGPLSALYGADAAAGVVQLFTRQAEPGLKGQATLTTGSLVHRQGDASISWKGGALDGSFSVSRVANRGFSATNRRNTFYYCGDALCTPANGIPVYEADRDGFQQQAGVLRLGWQLSEQWRADLLTLESKAQVDFDDVADVRAKLRLTSAINRLQLSGRPFAGTTTRISLGESRDEYQPLRSYYLRSASNPTGAASAPLVNQQRQIGLEQQIQTPYGTALVLLERLEQQVVLPPDDVTYAKTRRATNGFGLGFDGQIDALAWQAALRHDVNATWGNQLTGSLGASYAVSPQWKLGGSLGSSFVAPSFQLLYYPGYSNPDLKPEIGRHTEIFVQWRPVSNHEVRIARVENHMKNLIATGPAPFYLPANVAESSINGITMHWRVKWGPLNTQVNIDQIEPIDIQTGLQLARRAKSAARLAADLPIQAWTVGARWTAWSGRFNDASNTERLAGFGTLDLRAERPIAPEWTLGLRVDNLMDKVYETALGYNQPRRGAYLTLRWASR